MSIISGGLAKKYLKVSVSLATDESTISWAKESGTYETLTEIFDNILIVDRPTQDNFRSLHDGSEKTQMPFVNGNRYSAWDITPYDRTLLIDSDFLIFTDDLNNFWDLESDLLISHAINDIFDNDRIGYHDRYISDTGIKLYWATTVLFTKNEKTKTFFDLVQTIKSNYSQFADLFRFDSRQYRNDISFSIAKHILDGFEELPTYNLPPVLSTIDKDELVKVCNNKLIFLSSPKLDNNFITYGICDRDIHIMNKQSIIRNYSELRKLI